MIPYFEWTEVHIGPLTLYVWGFFVAFGILAGLQVSRWFGKKQGLIDVALIDSATWGIIGGLVGARLGYVLFYNFAAFLHAPLKVFAIWDGGMSMAGGLIGAIAAILWFLHKEKLPVLPYLDAITFGLPLGYGCGRIGCFLIHDHPGTATHFVLGVKYPDGIVRHDHGLYLSIFGFITAGVFFTLYKISQRKKWNLGAGFWTGLYFTFYGATRIWLDFYRVNDAVYFGLTPAQWISLGFVLGGMWLLARAHRITIVKQ